MATPLVSVIVPAFNLSHFLPAALESALAQTDPGGPIEVIVVDDGSTDDTPQVLARYEERVHLIRQTNTGFVRAVERALTEVRGTYIALLDADDEWPRDRLARHVAILNARPEVGLVHGDMELIDAEGRLIHPSFFQRQGLHPVDGRALGPLLANNFVSGGASTFRRALLPAIVPFEPEVVYPDWRIAVGVASVSKILHDRASANRYRRHDANMGLDADAARRGRILRAELPWRRWMLHELAADPSVSVVHLRGALQSWRETLTTAALAAEVPVRALIEVEKTTEPLRGSEARDWMRAFAADPFDGAIALELEIALAREVGSPPRPLPPPPSAVRGRGRLTLAWLPDVVRFPEILEAYAEATRDSDEDSVAILAPPDADPSHLVAMVQSSPLLSDERCDIQLLTAPATPPARAWLRAQASARLMSSRDADPENVYGSLPLHPSAGLVAGPA